MESPHTGKPISLPLTEWLKTVPEIFGIRLNEQPTYEVVERDDPVEVRRYPALATASVTVRGHGEDARVEAFKRLAAYIFGENRRNARIAMTSPVQQRPVGSEVLAMTSPVLEAGTHDRGVTMTFVLPSAFVTREPPAPVDPMIVLGRQPERLVAAARYSGNDTERRRRQSVDVLRQWFSRRPDYRAKGEPFFAVYDAPFALPFVKRNEIQVEVAPSH